MRKFYLIVYVTIAQIFALTGDATQKADSPILIDLIADLNSWMPRQLNPTTILTKASLHANQITLHFEVDASQYPEGYREEYGVKMGPALNTLVKFACDFEYHGSSIADYVQWRFNFKTNTGEIWGSYDINPEHCQSIQ